MYSFSLSKPSNVSVKQRYFKKNLTNSNQFKERDLDAFYSGISTTRKYKFKLHLLDGSDRADGGGLALAQPAQRPPRRSCPRARVLPGLPGGRPSVGSGAWAPSAAAVAPPLLALALLSPSSLHPVRFALSCIPSPYVLHMFSSLTCLLRGCHPAG